MDEKDEKNEVVVETLFDPALFQNFAAFRESIQKMITPHGSDHNPIYGNKGRNKWICKKCGSMNPSILAKGENGKTAVECLTEMLKSL